MNQVKQLLFAVMDRALRFLMVRKNIGVRFVYTLFYMFVCGILNFALMVLTFLQFFCLILTTKHSEAIKVLSHKLTVYAYKALRYITLNENLRPYPFSKLPDFVEPAEDTDLSAPMPEKTAFSAAQTAEAETAPEATAEPETPATPSETEPVSEDKSQEPIILDHKES